MARLLTALTFAFTLLFAHPAIAGERMPSAVASLLFDMQKVVDVQHSAGWKIDKYEYEAMMPDALMSVCRTTEETRSSALTQARREVTRLSGDAPEELQRAERVAHLLEEAVRRAPTDCPPWVEQQRDFRALQAGVNRFVLSVEASGSGMVQHASSHPDGTTGFRGARGGGGRLLLGRGYGHHWSVRVGPEVNVHMLVRQQANPAELPLQIQAALPIVARYTAVSWHYNVEVAPLLMLTDADLVPRYCGRLGVLIGISRLKTRSVIPWAGLALMVELFPRMNGGEMLLNLKGGVRVGFDWDFTARQKRRSDGKRGG